MVFPPRTATHPDRPGERGFSLAELLVVIGLAGVIFTMTGVLMWDSYRRGQVSWVSRRARNLVAVANMKALKEKVPHRLVFHDTNAATPNTIELQRDSGGSFVTLPGYVYEAPQGVEILGSGATDSADDIEVGTRGACDAGKIYIGGRDQPIRTVTVEPSCHTREF